MGKGVIDVERIFYWMHRDTKCTTIKISSTTNAVYFTNHTDQHLLCAFGKEVSPVNMDDFYDLLETRIAPIREQVDDRKTYRMIGCSKLPTIEYLISQTYGMIADDFFWICEEENTYSFDDIRDAVGLQCPEPTDLKSLKEHKFTEEEMYGIPYLTTRASQPKWVYKGWFIKKDRWGYESMAEMLCSILAKYVRGIQALDYILLPPIDGRGVCASPLYTDRLSCEFVSFWNIITKSNRYEELPPANLNGGMDLLEKVIQIVSEETGMNMDTYIRKMLMWDALILNTDRHYNNMAVRRSNTGQYTTMPFFDHGLSLLSGYSMNDLTEVRARVYTQSFSQCVELAGKDNMLEIDMVGFCEHLDKLRAYYKEHQGYYAHYFNKVSTILITRLLDTKGTIWKAVGREAYTINTSHYLEWQLSNGFNGKDYKEEVEKFQRAMKTFDEKTCLTTNKEDMAYGRH